MRDLCKTSNGMLNAFVERWITKTSSFHLPHGEMFITLEEISCLLHLSIKGKLLDHEKINRDDALVLVVDYLGVNSEASMKKFEATRGVHVRFLFLEKVYTYELLKAQQAFSDDEHVA
ncbi:unnamed protein product [Lathyrus oleraceus]